MMELETLQTFWFITVGFFLAGYAILDGFDLGVGIMHMILAKTDEERRLMMNSIGPLWDGNEVWLVVFGGALFAAFPEAYATAFSTYYLPLIFVLFALIFRAVSLEFRSKSPSKTWRATWDIGFSLASCTATLIFGVAVGGTIRGIPLNERLIFTGSLIDLFHPYALLVGALAVSLFAMHGTIFVYLKTEGALQERAHQWMWRTFGLFLVLYMFTTIATLQAVPSATANFERYPIAWVIVALNVLAVANIPRAIHLGRPGYAFVSSCATIAALATLYGAALYPNLIISTGDTSHSITIANASSSHGTLHIMQIIAFIGAPLVLTYTVIIYWVFRGKVTLDKNSY
jgi:cytochrome d ubiquinol oxidase subunit II